jgi:hypothetical protein
MSMRLQEYRSLVRRSGLLGFFLFFVIAIPLVGLGSYAAHNMAQTHHWLTNSLQGWIRADLLRPTVFLLFLPVLCAPFCLSAWIIHRLDRRIGCQCPNCGRSLTIRCDPKQIIQDGLCPACRKPVIDLTR